MLATHVGARNAALNVTNRQHHSWSSFLLTKDKLVLALLSETKCIFVGGSSGKPLAKCSLDRDLKIERKSVR